MVVIGKILCSPVVHTFLWIKKTLSTLFSIKDGRIEQMFAAGELPQFFNCVCCSLVFLFFFSFFGFFFFVLSLIVKYILFLVVPVLVRDSVLEIKIYGPHVRKRLPSNI